MSENRPNRAKLAEYYKISDAVEPKSESKSSSASPVTLPEKPVSSPYDINSASFDPEIYSQKLIKEASLSQIMAQEGNVYNYLLNYPVNMFTYFVLGEIVRQIHSLDSDMQTLVYENYNKFIAATDTIKKMRVDFREMEDEMDSLADKMKTLTQRSAVVNDNLKGKRAKVSELSSTHALLKKLQFLFELPAKLKNCIEEENWSQGVHFYVRAQRVLDQYQHMPSFSGIKVDCDNIMLELKGKLKGKLTNVETSPQQMAECVHLLSQLNEPVEQLCEDYLSTSHAKLKESLDGLVKQVEVAANSEMDVLEFVDQACNGFISDLCSVIGAFNDTFNMEEVLVAEKLNTFVLALMEEFMTILKERMLLETNLSEMALLVRALDRFYKRLLATCRLMPVCSSPGQVPNVGSISLAKNGMSLVLDVAKHACDLTLQSLRAKLDEDLLEVRKLLVAPRALNSSSSLDLRSMNRKLMAGVGERLRQQMTNLQLFLDPELTFAVKTNFRTTFCRSAAREGVAVAHFKHILDVADNFCSDDTTDRTVPPLLLLLLSRACLDLQMSTMQNVMSQVDEQFFIDESAGGLTSVSRLGSKFTSMSSQLLSHYTRLEGQVLSQMLRKSVETRDWLNNVEPRSVRAVMKRVVEETSSIDRQVGELYEEGSRKARSSDSSRRSGARFSQRVSTQRSWVAAANTSFASNIQKMFSEKIEIFSPVEASKVSILTGIIKIALKTFMECVRLKTFSRFGFQQMQVDVHYLSLYLWRFVSDENLVTFMLDEVMSSCVHRVSDTDIVPMEQSVVELLCNRN